MALTKPQRLAIFCSRMSAAAPAASADEAKALMDQVLNEVEDEFSGVPFQKDSDGADGRMYPAAEDKRTEVKERPDLRRYRHRSDETFIGANGAILIRSLRDGSALLDLPGADGQFVGL